MANRWQRGYWRDDDYNLLMVDEGVAVAPLRYRQGYLIDANNELVTSPVVAGATMKQGHLRRPSGALVVTTAAPTKFRQGHALGSNNELAVILAPQAGSGTRQGDARVLASGALLYV